MGSGIAHVAAMSGFNVILTDISEEALSEEAGIEICEEQLQDWEEVGQGCIDSGRP